jgi:serine protein kinase
MRDNLSISGNEKLTFHIQEVLAGRRRFENAAQAVTRMILEKPIVKITRAGKTVYDYTFFREGKRHIIGWYDEINDFVSFAKNAASGGSAKEMAMVLIGEPGNGKTFFIDYVCKKYRQFLSKPENRRYTFKFIGLDKALGYDPRVSEISSLTFEDPMILAMNLFEDMEENKRFFNQMGFKDEVLEGLYGSWRPLGASTEYLWHKLMAVYGDVQKALEHIKIIPVPMTESLGTVTGKYSAKDKITSSSVDLLGEESLQNLLFLPSDDPNRFDLQRGALARVAGGGIHFSDEIFKNKADLIKIYLQIIQNRNIELDGFNWPIDTLIIATSNNNEYNKFISQGEEAPVKDRCRICYVSHNTDYKLQFELTKYALGSKEKKTITGKPMHQDPNLIFAASVAAVLTRLLNSEKLNPIEMMKLEAGEVAGEKGPGSLAEVKESANKNPDVTKRWGQKGLGHRDLSRALQIIESMVESNEGECMFAEDVFSALERVILDYVAEANDRNKYLEDLKIARKLYREQIKTSIYNAFREDPQAIKKDVMAYVNMIIGISAESLGPDKIWRYKDPQTQQMKALKIEEKYINAVEERMGRNNKEVKEAFRIRIRNLYGQKVATDPNYDFMDEQELVRAVTEVRLESDVGTASSLIGALTNRTNEENLLLYNKMLKIMVEKLGYCATCAQKTIQYFCEKTDE